MGWALLVAGRDSAGLRHARGRLVHLTEVVHGRRDRVGQRLGPGVPTPGGDVGWVFLVRRLGPGPAAGGPGGPRMCLDDVLPGRRSDLLDPL